MKKLLLIISILLMSVSLFSCKKDKLNMFTVGGAMIGYLADNALIYELMWSDKLVPFFMP